MTNSRHALAVLLAMTLLAGCSREKIDWKSAEAADTVEAYDHFLERHPDGELSTQARARVSQLNEERDWKRASATDTLQAYQQFLAQHENGKWTGEARIRVENFALDGTPTGPMRPAMDPEVTPAPSVAGSTASSAVGAGTAPSVSPAPASASSTATTKLGAATHSTAKPAASGGTPSAAGPTVAVARSVSGGGQVAGPSATQFGIQLGAFRSQQAAMNDWKRIQARFDGDLRGLFARAVPVEQAAGQLFRLQAPVGNEAKARAICASLAKQSQPCVVVLPQAH